MKKLLRKLAIAFGVLMFFLAIDIAVAWYLYPKAATPVQAVRMEATHVALEIFAKTMRAQLKKEKEEQATSAATPPTASAASAAPIVQPPQQLAPQSPAAQPKPQQLPETNETPTAPPPQPPQLPQPQQTTETTTKLDDVQAEDNILVYKIVADANGADFDYVMQQMRAEMFPADCSKPEYSKLMEYGIGITLDFQSQDSTKHEQIMFTPQLCGFEPIPPSQQQPQ